jgi:signal transduction histidine kinase
VEVKGVGLGLAVSYGIAGRHGGTIEATSQEGKGSTFTVCLPSYIPGSTTDYGKAR